MDNLNVSKEIIHIKKNQSSTATQASDLVFLELSGQVVCLKCHQEHYFSQSYRPFRGRGSCQCLHPDCGETERERYKMMVKHKNKDSGEIKTECLFCTAKSCEEEEEYFVNFVISASIVKNTVTHTCTHNFEQFSLRYNGFNFCDYLFPFFTEKNAWPASEYTLQSLAGSSLYIERYQCLLSQSLTIAELKKKENDFAFCFLNTIIQSQIPWLYTSPELITMINPKYKQLFSQRARKALLSILESDSEESIDNWLSELFIKGNESKKSMKIQICFFLESCFLFEKSNNASLPGLFKRTKPNEILKSSSIPGTLIGLGLIQLDDQNWEKFVKKESNKKLIENMKTELTLKSISKFENLNRMASALPIYGLDVAVPNEFELISLSDRINFLIRQAIYGDYTQEQSLSFFKEILSNIISLLGISNSINHKEGTSSPLTPDQKAKLFYSTPLVNTILMTAQILKEEHHKALGFDLPTAQFESVFTDMFSIMMELGRECYDISMLWFSNFKTLVDGHLPDSSRAEFEILHIKTLRYLLDFNSNSTYIEEVMEINNEILYKVLCFIFSTQLEQERKSFEYLECSYITNLAENKEVRKFISNQVFILIGMLYFPEDLLLYTTDTSIAEKVKDLQFSKKYYMLAFIMPETNQEYVNLKIRKEIPVPAFHESLADKVFDNPSINQNEKMFLVGLDIFGVKSLLQSDYCLSDLHLFNLNKFAFYSVTARVMYSSKNYKVNLQNDLGLQKVEVVSKHAELTQNSLTSCKNLFEKANGNCHALLFLNATRKIIKFSNLFDKVKSKIASMEFEDVDFYSHIKTIPRLNEYLYELTQNTEIDVKNDKAVKSYLLSISGSVPIHTSEITSSRFVSLVKHIGENNYQEYIDFFNDCSNCSIEVAKLKIDFVEELFSKKYISKFGKDDLNKNIFDLARHLGYRLIKFLNSETSEFAFDAFKLEESLVSNLIQIFLSLTKSKEIETKKLFSEDKIEFCLEMMIDRKYNAYKLKDKRTFLEFLIILAIKFVSNIYQLRSNKEKTNVFLSLLSLMSEILEGVQPEAIQLLVQKQGYFFERTSENAKILRKWQDVFLKVYFDLHTTDTQKLSIKREMNTSALLDRIKELKDIHFIKDTLESTEENKLDKLITLYYSNQNTSYEQFDRLILVFTFLRFHSDYDLSEETNQDLILIIKLLDKIFKEVEVKIDDTFREVFFFTHPDALLFSKDKIYTFIDNVDRSSIAAKNQDIIEYALHFRDEIEIEKSQSDTWWRKLTDRLDLKWLVLICLIITLGSVYLMVNHTDVSVKQIQDSAKSTFVALLIVQMVIAITTLSIWLATKFRPVYSLFLMQFRTENNISKGEETVKDKLICRFRALFYSVEPVCAFGILFSDILAVSSDSLYWTVSLQLLCFIAFSKNLANIIKAIQLRSKQLGLISVFLVILLFISGVLTFTYMSESFQTEDGDMLCLTMGHCLASQLDYGFRMGGGMGDNMPVEEWDTRMFWRKFVYSMSHFILFPVIMLNVVAGIIIDTFADLREQTAQLQEDKEGVCIVCGKEIGEIKKEEGSYVKHVKEKHNVVNYMLFIKYILEKEEIELNYIEEYVRNKVEEKKIDWFPSNEEDLDSKLEKLKNEMKNEVNTILKELSVIKEMNFAQFQKINSYEDKAELETAVLKDLEKILPTISKHIDLQNNEELTSDTNSDLISLPYELEKYGRSIINQRYPPIIKDIFTSFTTILKFIENTEVNL